MQQYSCHSTKFFIINGLIIFFSGFIFSLLVYDARVPQNNIVKWCGY
jgi:hypothetical protein